MSSVGIFECDQNAPSRWGQLAVDSHRAVVATHAHRPHTLTSVTRAGRTEISIYPAAGLLAGILRRNRYTCMRVFTA